MRLSFATIQIFVLSIFLGTSTIVLAQPIPTGQSLPLPSLQDRVNQLQGAGVPSDFLPGSTGGINLPTGSVPSASVQPQANSGSGLPTGGPPVNLEGAESNVDPEDAEYEDKPLQINEIKLQGEVDKGVFGLHLFKDSMLRFSQPSTRIPPDDYVIGPGDIFGITVYGRSELYESLVVEDDGSVIRQSLGKVYVGGLTYGAARSLLEQRYKSFVSSRSTVEILLVTNRRSINVNIVGEVRRPGSYRISAATPAFNALFAADGINELGTVRNILIKRGNKLIEILDIYEYLIYGKDAPIFLQDNDFIFVPVQGKVVEVEGAVKRPRKYELLQNENLQSLITFSGGVNFDALLKTAQVARLDRSIEREVLQDIPLTEYLPSSDKPNNQSLKDYQLFDGDRLIIDTVNKGAYNIVQVFGTVEYPGTYQLNPGERVSDLIARAGGLGIDAYLDRAYIVRIVPNSSELEYRPINLNPLFQPDTSGRGVSSVDSLALDSLQMLEEIDPHLQYFDGIVIFSKNDFRDERFIEVEGEVRVPQIVQTYPGMSLKDLLFKVGGPKRDADLNNIELAIITRAEDLDIERLRRQGEDLGEGLEDLGEGEGEGAEGEGVSAQDQVVRRISINQNWQEDPSLDTLTISEFDRLKIYSKYDFIFFKYIEIEGAVVNPGRYQLKRGMNLKDLLYQAGGLAEDADVNEVELYVDIPLAERGNHNTSTDKKEIIRVQIEEDWQKSMTADSLDMAPFHKVVVRSEKDFFAAGSVLVKGLVNNPDTFEVYPNMSLRDLLYMAGGLKIEADYESIELSRVVETETSTGEIIPIPVVINTVSTTQNWQRDTTLDEIRVNSFDMVFVRKNPAFELQESVFIEGEVFLEGEFVKATKAERISSLVARAGGITELADLEGAYLLRENIGSIAIKLDRALRRPNSKYDISLLERDTLVIPPRVDVVTLTGNVLREGTTVLYEPSHRRMKYYVNLAGGFDRRTKKNLSTVSYVDGRVKRTRKFLFLRRYPKIEQGSLVYVESKPEKGDRGAGARPRVRINITEVLSAATSVLTFYLLIDRTFPSE